MITRITGRFLTNPWQAVKLKKEAGEDVDSDDDVKVLEQPYVMYHCDDSYNITLRDRHGNVIKRDDLDRWTALYTSFTVI